MPCAQQGGCAVKATAAGMHCMEHVEGTSFSNMSTQRSSHTLPQLMLRAAALVKHLGIETCVWMLAEKAGPVPVGSAGGHRRETERAHCICDHTWGLGGAHRAQEPHCSHMGEPIYRDFSLVTDHWVTATATGGRVLGGVALLAMNTQASYGRTWRDLGAG